MMKEELLYHCLDTYGTAPDYPFENDFESAVLRHSDNRKWYALIMRVPKSRFRLDDDTAVDVVNLKLPTEMFGSFGAADGVYPAYHMNKNHWISVLLDLADDETVKFLVNASYEVTKSKWKRKVKLDEDA